MYVCMYVYIYIYIHTINHHNNDNNNNNNAAAAGARLAGTRKLPRLSWDAKPYFKVVFQNSFLWDRVFHHFIRFQFLAISENFQIMSG